MSKETRMIYKYAAKTARGLFSPSPSDAESMKDYASITAWIASGATSKAFNGRCEYLKESNPGLYDAIEAGDEMGYWIRMIDRHNESGEARRQMASLKAGVGKCEGRESKTKTI